MPVKLMAIATKLALSAHHVVSAMNVANAAHAMAVVANAMVNRQRKPHAMKHVQRHHKANPLWRAASSPVNRAKVDVATVVVVAAATTVAHARTKRVSEKRSKPRWALSKAMPRMQNHPTQHQSKLAKTASPAKSVHVTVTVVTVARVRTVVNAPTAMRNSNPWHRRNTMHPRKHPQRL